MGERYVSWTELLKRYTGKSFLKEGKSYHRWKLAVTNQNSAHNTSFAQSTICPHWPTHVKHQICYDSWQTVSCPAVFWGSCDSGEEQVVYLSKGWWFHPQTSPVVHVEVSLGGYWTSKSPEGYKTLFVVLRLKKHYNYWLNSVLVLAISILR